MDTLYFLSRELLHLHRPQEKVLGQGLHIDV